MHFGSNSATCDVRLGGSFSNARFGSGISDMRFGSYFSNVRFSNSVSDVRFGRNSATCISASTQRRA